MIIIPGQPALQETRHSRELQGRVEKAIREYQREHPDATEADVRIALMKSTPGDAPEVQRRRTAIAVAIAAAVMGAFTATASSGGNFTSQTWVMIFGIVAAVGGVAFAAIRLARRS
jgi:hypothetical protein